MYVLDQAKAQKTSSQLYNMWKENESFQVEQTAMGKAQQQKDSLKRQKAITPEVQGEETEGKLNQAV